MPMLDHELWSKERASCTRRIGIPSRMGNARRSASLMSSLAAASYRSGDLDTGQQINSSSAGSCKKTICQTKHDNMTNRTNLATLAAFDSTAVDEKSRREATPRRIMMVAVAGKPTVVSRDEYTRDQTFWSTAHDRCRPNPSQRRRRRLPRRKESRQTA